MKTFFFTSPAASYRVYGRVGKNAHLIFILKVRNVNVP